MAENKMITEAMQAQIGRLVNVHVMRVDQRMVDQYLLATGDLNPLWRDRAAALRAGYEDVPVPPGLISSMQMEGDSPTLHMQEQAHLGGAVDGGGEWEFFHPVYVGDVICATRKLLGIKEREGKLGGMILNTFEVTYQNQKSIVVAKSRWTTVRYATKE